MINPVEQIAAARRRLKQVAALRAGLTLALPALTALVLAATLDAIGEATWERAGYALTPARLGGLRAALALAGVVALAGCALMAWRAWREADDFIEAAELVDDAVGGHQEIVTLASLADPAEPPAQRELRTPLFPLLWRRASGYLERFDPNGAFAFEVRRPLVRSLPIAAAMVVLLAAVALALVRPPSAEQVQARKLRAAAQQLASSPSSADKDLAAKILAAADALENPKLPPPEKLARLAEAMSELQKHEQQGSSPQQSAKNTSGSGNGKNNSGKGAGQGNGQSQDSGNGQGKSQGQGQGANQGNNPNGPKGKEQIVELQNGGKQKQRAQARPWRPGQRAQARQQSQQKRRRAKARRDGPGEYSPAPAGRFRQGPAAGGRHQGRQERQGRPRRHPSWRIPGGRKFSPFL
jgi:hypothetical protein